MMYLAFALWPYLLVALCIGLATGYFLPRDGAGGGV